jgi:hypothetical protein
MFVAPLTVIGPKPVAAVPTALASRRYSFDAVAKGRL